MKIFRFDSKTTEFRTLRVFIRQNIEKLCIGKNDSVSNSYIMNSNGALAKASFILIAMKEHNRITRSKQLHFDISNIKGFLIGKIRQSDIYVDVICGSGTGLALMKEVREIAIKEDKQFLRLSGLPGPMMAYFNYKLPESFIFSESSCKQVDSIQEITTDITKTFKKYKADKNIYSLKKYDLLKKKLVKLLIKLKLTSNKSCKIPRTCDVDGYSMLLCIKSA
tara:strand:+ start:124 stop:789 length:666 start_codon:yes stop_codon:yes gene_type:complete